jgi:tRNA pseudouridine55 synthase
MLDSGVVILDKPEGISSSQALARVKRIFQVETAGHTGTLDVLASGLLPICLNEATKFSQFLLEADKYYRVTARLGARTKTGDREGEIIEPKPTDHLTREKILDALEQFRGKISQVPPMYSALKHQGQPLYRLARRGIEVERKLRILHIRTLELLDFKKTEIILDVRCSKGTYIRSLVDDLGQAIGCGAYVLSLRRLGSGIFTEEQMVTFEQLAHTPERGQCIHPILSFLEHLPKIHLSDDDIKRLYFGQSIPTPNKQEKQEKSNEALCLFRESSNEFIGIGQISQEGVLSSKRLMKKENL